MSIRRIRPLMFIVLLLVALLGFSMTAFSGEQLTTGQFFRGSFEHGGIRRSYEYYIPPGHDRSAPVPLVFSFHGLGSSGAGQRLLTGLEAVAEREGFILVFPDSTRLTGTHPQLPALPGSNIQWNIGVDMSLQYRAGVDDVGFVSEIIDRMVEKYNIDLTRVYATGMSNGAMFSYYLAFQLPDRIAAVAAVTSPMTANLAAIDLKTPTSVILMMGTEDPIVPFGGGRVFMSSPDTINYWKRINKTDTVPVVTEWPATEADPTHVIRRAYSGGLNGTEVIFYEMRGAGHTWPGGPQYLPVMAIGRVSRHINGSAAIWSDLKKHQLKVLDDIATHWGGDSIRRLARMGILAGYPDGNFKPNAYGTRGEFVAMLVRALGLKPQDAMATVFTDEAGFGWARGAISAAVRAGLVAGYADGTFGASRPITRKEIAVILDRVLSKGLAQMPMADELTFADAEDIPAWAKSGVRTAGKAGLVRGFPDGTFLPGNPATRAEQAVMLHRLVTQR